MEATSALLALLTDNNDNQAAAVKAGVVPLLVQVSHSSDKRGLRCAIAMTAAHV